jgi:predicted DNA-binding protein YlxM (UPF0122 family)
MDDIEEDIIQENMEEVLECYIATLNPKDKLVIELLEKDISKTNIARELNITRQALNNRLNKIRDNFKKKYSNYFP